jgi:prolipoprotein diacylglyceryltransferase
MMFWILLGVRRVKRFHGQMFLVWIAAYPVIRSIIEMFRGDTERGIYFYLSTSQWISIGVAAAAIGLYVYLRKRRSEQAAPATG